MKVYYFSEKDNIYKIFQVLDNLPSKKKEIFLEIHPKNEFFSNKWWAKLVLEKTEDLHIKPVFIISNQKQENLLKIFGANYIWKKEPIYKKIQKTIFEFINIFRWNSFFLKNSKTLKIFILTAEIAFTLLVIFFIYNLVTPRTDIYIQPAINIKHIIQKVYISSSNKKIDKLPVIKYYTWEMIKTISIKLPVKDITFLSKPAKWTIKLINHSTIWYSLKAHTQLITENWLIFKLKTWIYVPPAKSPQKPWIAYAKVIADKFDVKWNIIWEKWNIIKWTKLFIRKLYASIGKKKIYAIANKDFSNWETNPTWKVSVDDIENIKKYLKEKLNKNVKLYIQNYVKSQNKDYQPLLFFWMYKITSIDYLIDSKPWEEKAYLNWNLQAKILFSYIKKSDIKKVFKQYLKDHIVSLWEFIWWNESSLAILWFEKVFDNLYLSTINFDALLWYDFENDYNKIKENILNKVPSLSVEEAKQIILSYPVIANVQIKTTNSLNKVSSLKSRIFIHIVK